MRRCRLPDGTTVVGPGRLECRFLYREIFVDRAYLGGTVQRGGCVVDVGAHVGLFGLWASRHLEPSRLLLFEPIPELFGALDENARSHFPTAERHNIGLAREAGSARFRYYPLAAGWSSALLREDLLRESLLAYLQRGSLGPAQTAFRVLGRLAPRLQRALHDLVCSRIFATARDVDCPVDSLSGLMDRHAVEQIDLLKLDVEGSEIEVLAGVRDEHWPQIRAVAAEVEDVDGSLERARKILALHGMRVHARQAPELEGTPFHLVWATSG